MASVTAGLAACVLVLGAIGIHALLGRSNDAWAAAVQAASTVALVGITGWYAYLTLKLVETQRSSPRRTAWEAALRDLSRFMARNHKVIWTASAFFPVDSTANPPMLLDILASRDALTEVRESLLECVGVLPKEIAGSVLGVAGHVLNAETELHALGCALLEETQAGLAVGRGWTWDGAEAAHLATEDPERNESWDDVLRGRWVTTSAQLWEKLSLSLDGELIE
jgi:hypothetical protein